MLRHALLALSVATLTTGATVGCAVESEEPATAIDSAVITDPNAMPQPILRFLSDNGWGDHHLEWHIVRNYDVLQPADQKWARDQGWARADVQEGARTNGLEFLAMHRVIIGKLKAKFAKDASLFEGFAKPPLECNDEEDPCGPQSQGPFDAERAKAVDKLQNHLEDFEDDDELGLFIETSMRPTAADPNARTKDKSAGIHNYLHNRFSDRDSPVNLNDPSKNLQNRKFWRLHGWIESRWTEFRKLKGFSDGDPTYRAALKRGEDMFAPPALGAGPRGLPARPPQSVRDFFATKD